MKFRNFLKELDEEMTSGDVATVDSKMQTIRRNNKHKGKRCKKHKRFNCLECTKDYKEKEYNEYK